jgi:hypothetical protein
MDIYALYCDKGMAFDFVTSEILNIKSNGDEGARVGGARVGGARVGGILYLEDSENDNPEFRKVSIGAFETTPITSLRTAVENGEGSLDKEATSYDDCGAYALWHHSR